MLEAAAQPRNLSLDEALSLALANNKQLQAEILQAESAHEEVLQAKANLRPVVAAHGSYAYYFNRQVIFMPGSFTGNAAEPVVDVAVGGKNVFNTYLSFQQALLSPASKANVKSTLIEASLRKLHVKEHRTNLIMDVTATYYQVVLLNESIAVNQESLQRNERSLRDSRLLLLQGKSLKVDTLRNFVMVENLKTTLSQLENQKKVAMLQLCRSLGLDGSSDIILRDSLHYAWEELDALAIENADDTLLDNRTDIQMQMMNVELSKSRLRQAKAQRLPVLSLAAMYQLQAQADNRDIQSYRWPRTSFVGLQVQVPLFAGGRETSLVRQSDIVRQRSELLLEDAIHNANTELATALNNLRELLERLSVYERTILAAETNFKIINDRYANGLSSRLELSDAELALTEANLNRLYLIFNVKMARLHVSKALGRL